MFCISLLFACAKEIVVPRRAEPSGVQILETIDLESEFGTEANGWQYQLQLLSIEQGEQKDQGEQGIQLTLPMNTAWVVIHNDTVGESGFSPTPPMKDCVQGCTLLTASVFQADRNEPTTTLTEQFLSESAPKASSGLTLMDTWTESLKEFPIKNKSLRFRSVSLSETGVVGQHKHTSRPSFAYVVSGSVVEHRGDGDVSHQMAGRVAEKNGLVHWWESQSNATIVVFDIIDQ